MALHRVETALRDQLETLERIPDGGVETAQQQERAFRRIDADPRGPPRRRRGDEVQAGGGHDAQRSEEHTSELQSLMRISYAVFCLKKKITNKQKQTPRRRHQDNKH